MTSTLLEKAIAIAIKAHLGQKDKSGKEYILHPLRMMMHFKNEDEQILAILHDVIEDSDVTLEVLEKEGFSKDITDALAALTRFDYHENYDRYLNRIKANKLATKIKLADLTDNMDIRRMKKLEKIDLERLAKYNRAWHFLTESV